MLILLRASFNWNFFKLDKYERKFNRIKSYSKRFEQIKSSDLHEYSLLTIMTSVYGHRS